MILQQIFNNSFEFFIPEFFLAIIILVFLLFGTFFHSINVKNNHFFTYYFNNLIIFLLIILFFLEFNLNTKTICIGNGVLISDNLTKSIKLILILTTIICLSIQKKYLSNQKINSFENTILIIISLLGLMLLTSSYNLITVYLAIELQSLSFYILTVSQRRSLFSAEASLKYFILGSIASGFLLYGISYIYGTFGTFNFGDLHLILSNISFINNNDMLLSVCYGFFFFFIGLLFKIGAFPFHNWLPDVYEGSPNNITAFFAIVPKIAYIGLFLRLFFDVFTNITYFFENVLYITALGSIVLGSLSSLQQKKIKRLLAYSSISHVGFILIGFVSNSLNAFNNILFYIIVYILMSIVLWTVFLSLFINNKPIKYITDLTSLYRYNKLLSFIIALTLFSMAGIPPLIGFYSKMFIFYTAIKSNYFGLVFISILCSVISAFYYIRIIKIIFFDKIDKIIKIESISSINSFIIMIHTQLLLLFFFFPEPLLTYLNLVFLKFII